MDLAHELSKVFSKGMAAVAALPYEAMPGPLAAGVAKHPVDRLGHIGPVGHIRHDMRPKALAMGRQCAGCGEEISGVVRAVSQCAMCGIVAHDVCHAGPCDAGEDLSPVK
eukprot:gene6242-6064_t